MPGLLEKFHHFRQSFFQRFLQKIFHAAVFFSGISSENHPGFPSEILLGILKKIIQRFIVKFSPKIPSEFVQVFNNNWVQGFLRRIRLESLHGFLQKFFDELQKHIFRVFLLKLLQSGYKEVFFFEILSKISPELHPKILLENFPNEIPPNIFKSFRDSFRISPGILIKNFFEFYS